MTCRDPRHPRHGRVPLGVPTVDNWTMTDNPFDEKAATWDTEPGHVERAEEVARRMAQELELRPTMTVLEYGAGTGLVSEKLADLVGPLTLVDTSEGMREVMRQKIEAGRLPEAVVLDFDVTDTNGTHGTYELVFTVLTLHHMEDTKAALEGFGRLIQPGGHLVVVDLDEEDGSFHGEGMHVHHGFSRHHLEHLMHEAGFVDVTVGDCHYIEREDGRFPMFIAIGAIDPV